MKGLIASFLILLLITGLLLLHPCGIEIRISYNQSSTWYSLSNDLSDPVSVLQLDDFGIIYWLKEPIISPSQLRGPKVYFDGNVGPVYLSIHES